MRVYIISHTKRHRLWALLRLLELDEICTNIPELYVVSGTLNSEPSILNRPLGNQ